MFEPFRIASGTEPSFEHGVFNFSVGRWVGTRDGDTIALLPGRDGISLRTSFPDQPSAGTEQFAHDLLDMLKEGVISFGEYKIDMSANGIENCIVSSMRVMRQRFIDTGMRIRKLQGRGTLFDIVGASAKVSRWEHDYINRNPNAIITCLEPGPEKMIRVWQPN